MRRWIWTLALLTMLSGCTSTGPEARDNQFEIGGRSTVTLTQPTADTARPQIISVDLLPGRGMNIFQIRANLPGKGVVDLLTSPPIEQAKTDLASDNFGNASFSFGGAILAPFANRIRGKLIGDDIETNINGKTMHLPANWKGKKPGAERHAMHGLILASPMDITELSSNRDQAVATAELDAGDFTGHWPSKTNLTISATLNRDWFGFTVTAKNVGDEDLPMGIGWHPYFTLPSGKRAQARVKIPARQRALVNNYDDVFPTGELVPVGDFFDQPLGDRYIDDCFVDLERSATGEAVAEIIDPEAKYGLRVHALSPEISAFQMYSPPDKSFVAIEPQFNWADPYGAEWKGRNTGMKVLKPGESVTYSVRLEMFVP
ncbi:MAG TPA: aldose 1-epimerase [Bryobacteraceae bacterium]|nr:aldose 1-epimerase [Bryobacteraceae bacterium]